MGQWVRMEGRGREDLPGVGGFGGGAKYLELTADEDKPGRIEAIFAPKTGGGN